MALFTKKLIDKHKNNKIILNIDFINQFFQSSLYWKMESI